MSCHVPRPAIRAKLAFPSSLRLVTFACLAAAGTLAHAIEFGGNVGYEATYSDNQTRQADGKADWKHVPRAEVHALHESASWSIDASYRAEHRVYARDTYPDDTLVSGRTVARVAVLPNTLDWTLSHSSTEEPVNSRQADTPDNSQTTNVLSTGPQFQFRLDARTQASFGGSFQQVTAARSSNDSRRWTGNGQVNRSIDGATQVGLRVQHSDIDYDSEFGQDYRSTDVRLTASRDQGERTHLEIELGGVFVSTEDRPVASPTGGFVNEGGEDNFDWTGRLRIERAFTSTLRGALTAGRQVTDSGARLGTGIAVAGAATAGRSDERQSSLQEEVGLSLERDSGRLQTRVGLSYVRQQFDGRAERDEERRRLSLGGTYSIGPRLLLSGLAALERVEFQESEGEDERRSASLRLQWSPLSNLRLSCGASWEDRDGGRASSVDYDETGAHLGVNYEF